MRQLIIFLPFFLLIAIPKVNSQYSQVGLGFGTFHYWGDLTEKGPVATESHFAATIYYAYHIKNTYAIRLQFGAGEISAFDRNNSEISLVQRNLHFKSKIYEVALLGEINFVNLFTKSEEINTFSSYLYVGLAGFRFNPQAEYQGTWYDLQPLGTSGQGLSAYPDRKKYNLTEWSIPFGLRFEYIFGKKLSLGVDFGLRKTFTDSIDDVSYPVADNDLILQEYGVVAAALADRYFDSNGQNVNRREGVNRGNSEDKDWLGLIQFQVSYKFISDQEWRKMRNLFF